MSRTKLSTFHDWEGLKAEFLSGNETLRQFQRSHKIGNSRFWEMTNGWLQERQLLREQAVKSVKQKIIANYAGYVRETKELLVNLNKQFAAMLRKRVKVKTGTGEEEIIPMRPEEANAISNALANNVRTFRLLDGRSTSNSSVKVGGDASINVLVAQMIQKMKGNGEDTIGDIPDD